jgi:hypothetical protein
MRNVFRLFLGLTLASTATAGTHIERWQVGSHPRTGEPQKSFSLLKTKLGAFNLHTFGFTQTVWMYFVTLKGDRETYSAQEIVVKIFSPTKVMAGESPVEAVDSGFVRLDRTRNKIIISVRILREGKAEDFVGNGEYSIPSRPK